MVEAAAASFRCWPSVNIISVAVPTLIIHFIRHETKGEEAPFIVYEWIDRSVLFRGPALRKEQLMKYGFLLIRWVVPSDRLIT